MVTLTVTDRKTGQVAQASVTVRVIDTVDTDDDGVTDGEDRCPQVRGVPENDGCPHIPTHDYGCSIRSVYGSGIPCHDESIDTDGDGVPDAQDHCVFVP